MTTMEFDDVSASAERRKVVRELAPFENPSPSDQERQAMALLYDDGWSVGELAMVFECNSETVRRNLKFEGAWQ